MACEEWLLSLHGGNQTTTAADGDDWCTTFYDFYSDECLEPSNGEDACCDLVKKAYLDRCDHGKDDRRGDLELMVTIVVLLASFQLRGVVRRSRLRAVPEAGAPIIVGAVVGLVLRFSGLDSLTFQESLFLRILLPPIILAATFKLHKRAFRSNISIVLCFAVLGTLVASTATGLLVWTFATKVGSCDLDFVEAMLFGTLISSIDPVTVLAIFRSAGIAEESPLYVALFGESVLNDGVVFLLFKLYLDFLNSSTGSKDTIVKSVGFFALSVFGSVALGIASALLVLAYLRSSVGSLPPVAEAVVVLLGGFLPYYAASACDWSGIIAIVSGGLVIEPYVVFTMQGEAQRHLHVISDALSDAFETAVFAYVGIFMSSVNDYSFCPTLFLTTLVACAASRAAFVFPACSALNALNQRSNQKRDESIANLHTLEGAVSAAAPADPGGAAAAESRRLSVAGDSEGRSSAAAALGDGAAAADGASGGFFRGLETVRDLGARNAWMWRHATRDVAPLYGRGEQLMMWFSAMRGAMSFALVEAIPSWDVITETGSHRKGLLEFLTTAVIVFSVFFCGAIAPWLLDVLGLRPDADSADATWIDAPLLGHDFLAHRAGEGAGGDGDALLLLEDDLGGDAHGRRRPGARPAHGGGGEGWGAGAGAGAGAERADL